MLLESVVLGVVVGLVIRRGKLNWLAEIEIKGYYFVISAFLIEIVLGMCVTKGLVGQNLTFWIEALAYLCLFGFIWQNISNNLFLIIYIGIMLNAIVIFSNGGFMPVDVSAAQDYGYDQMINALGNGSVFAHTILNEQTHYSFLGDIFQLMPPYPFPKSFSIGDVLLSIGVFVILIKNAVIERSDSCI